MTGPDDLERDVHDELAFHQDMRAGDPTAPAVRSTASARALVKLARARDRRLALRRVLRELWFDGIDCVRRLRRSPGFTIGAVGMLAVGLGATTAVFGFANTLYFRPLPFADADRLTRIQEFSLGPDRSIRWVDASIPTLHAAAASGAFSRVAALRSSSVSLTVPGAAARHIGVGEVGDGWTDAVGVTPVAGRLFTPDEERTAADVAVISAALWRAQFGGAATVIGRPLVFAGGVKTVIGVLPDGFRFPYEADAWWPVSFAPDARGFFIFARLAPGVSLEQANARLSGLADQLDREWPNVIRGMTPRARPIRAMILHGEERVVLLLGWGVSLLLLIVGSNAAMLLTTRIVSRQDELVVRAALGCGWARQFRMLTLEAVLVFAAGGIAGIGVAWALGPALTAALPNQLRQQLALDSVVIDWRVCLFALGLAVVAGAMFGGWSAWKTTRASRGAASAASKAIGSAAGRRTAGWLIAAELALASALVAATGIVVGALSQTEHRDVGFSSEHLLTAQFELTGARFATGTARAQEVMALESTLGTVPGVRVVGTTTVNPLCCGDWGSRVTPEGTFLRIEDAPTVNYRLVSPAFFGAMGVQVISGRVFDAHDVSGAEPVVVVDRRLAARFWPNGDAVGQRIKRGGTASDTPWMRVVGVVAPIEDAGDYTETWYLPYLQWPDAASTDQLHVMMRVDDGDGVRAAVRHAIGVVDPSLAIIELRSMDEIKREALDQQRVGTALSGVFAVLGATLALAGVYGLVGFVVAGERRDMGVRIALGASVARVTRDVLWRVGRLAAAGALAGAVCVRLLEPRLLAALGAASGGDGWSAVALPCVLFGGATIAALIPAQRIRRIDVRRLISEP